jgi:hypothetical protein
VVTTTFAADASVTDGTNPPRCRIHLPPPHGRRITAKVAKAQAELNEEIEEKRKIRDDGGMGDPRDASLKEAVSMVGRGNAEVAAAAAAELESAELAATSAGNPDDVTRKGAEAAAEAAAAEAAAAAAADSSDRYGYVDPGRMDIADLVQADVAAATTTAAADRAAAAAASTDASSPTDPAQAADHLAHHVGIVQVEVGADGSTPTALG